MSNATNEHGAAQVITASTDSLADVFALRAARMTDIPFVVESWLQSEFKALPPSSRAGFFRTRKREVRALLGLDDVSLVVACSTDDPDAVVAWICRSPERVHFVFVRPEARCLGIARRLRAQSARSDA